MNMREAMPEDARYLVELLAQMGYTWSVPAMCARIESFKKNRDHIMVIEEKNQVVAVIAFGYFEQLRVPGSCCHVDTLVVDKAYRGQGLGKQLIAFAEEHARAAGAEAVELISANHRKKDGTHDFYHALDYKNHQTLDLAYFAKENLKNH